MLGGYGTLGHVDDSSDSEGNTEAGDQVQEEKQEQGVKQQTMELQWKSYVTNLKKSGTLSSALSVCDVSGSMSGEPMQVCHSEP